jgi:hypothetical protein
VSSPPEFGVRSAVGTAISAFGEIARAWSLNESEKSNLLGRRLGML